MNKVPIVFAFDDNYALPGSVAIMSLIEHAKKDTFYEVFVMCSDDLDVKHRKTISAHIQVNYADRASIEFVDIGDFFKDAPLTFHLSRAAYYRLLIHKNLPQYDKVIWCDVDILFRGDLTDLYQMDISKYYLGACISAFAMNHPEMCNFKGNTYTHDSFSSGVTLLNLKRFRKEKIETNFFDVIKKHGKHLLFLDQDILNEVCGKSYLKIPLRYNLFRDIHKDQFNEPYSKEFEGIIPKKDLKKEFDHAVVSHYEGTAGKPWTKTGFVEEWYTYATRSAFPEKGEALYEENRPSFSTKLKRTIKALRKWIIQIRFKKDTRIVRLLGVYFMNQRG